MTNVRVIQLLLIIVLNVTVFRTLAQETNSTDSARIVFIRPHSYAGAAALFKVKLADGQIIKLVDNSFYEMNVAKGTFGFAPQKSKNLDKIAVDANQTYYIRAYFIPGFWTMTPELLLVDSGRGNGLVINRKLKNMRKPLLRPLNRVGLTLNAGFGFNDIAVGKTEDSTDIYMGFAGGGGVSVHVGREVSKYLDIAVSYSYMNRGLTPYIKNGTVDFSRHFVSATPSLIIPIQGGYGQRLKIGGGVDYYLLNTLDSKMNKIPGGFNDTWKYNQVLGFHAQLMYEVHMSEHLSFVGGLKYYNVGYEFKSGGAYVPIDSRVAQPKGDGIDMRIGFNYHFY